MNGGWRFPYSGGGEVNGLGDAGIETFTGAPARSLAREICQNSLDARRDSGRPVTVEFDVFTMRTSALPGVKTLVSVVQLCVNFWERDPKYKKIVSFFTSATDVLSKQDITILRVSDFNTTGLRGSDKEYGTPWHNLTRSSGVSDKGGDAGGSFGIGKSAPFASSALRTVFYSTLDDCGLKASQGVAKLTSFKFPSGKISSGVGYFSGDKEGSPVRDCYAPDAARFERNEPGTDLYIVGFTGAGELWKEEVICAVLDDFLVAIWNRQLVVRLCGEEISRDTLERTVNRYKDKKTKFDKYFQVLIAEEENVFRQNIAGLGEAELRLVFQPDQLRSVMMCRKSGMKIFDKKNISGSIQFAGICTLVGERLGAFFRDMENPAHDKWEPNRAPNQKLAAKVQTELFCFIRDTVRERGKSNITGQMDAEGAGEYLPDIGQGVGRRPTLAGSPESPEKNYGDFESISEITLKVRQPRNAQKGFERSLRSMAEEFGDETADPEDQEYGFSGGKDFGEDEPNKKHVGSRFGGGRGDGSGFNGDGDNPFMSGEDVGEASEPSRKTEELRLMSIRLFMADPVKRSYVLNYTPEQTAGQGYLTICLSGEQGKAKTLVLEARDLLTGAELRHKDEKIFLDNILPGQKNRVMFRIDYAGESSLEVDLYGYTK